MILLADDALDDLLEIERSHGHAVVQKRFNWCKELDEPATRLGAERMSRKSEIFRLLVDDFHIVFQLHESAEGDAVHILRVRDWRSSR